jgi:hypothetical protein
VFNRIIVAVAPTGSGKTHAVSAAFRECERAAVFDMVHEPAYLTGTDLIVGQPRAFAECLKGESFRVCYRPIIFSMMSGEEYCPEFEPFLKCCYLRGGMWAIIDEAHQLCSPHMCPDVLLSAVRLGRHRGLNLIFATQSFSAISRPITQNANEFWFWKIIEPSDIEGISQRCGREVAKKVTALRRLERTKEGKIIPGETVQWTAWEGMKQ